MSKIRVTYAGGMSFIVGLVSILTGLIFTLIITRRLTQEEFGTWGLIGGLTAYVFILEPLISYWVIREIARGEESGKTAILSSGLISVVAVFAYVIIVYFYGTQGGVDPYILFFAALLIPVGFIQHTITAINWGYKPHTGAYGLLIFELTKIPVALILVYFLDMGLQAAILTVIIASLANIVFQLIDDYDKIRGKFNKKYLKKWFRLFWLPTYPQISKIVLNSDVVIFTVIVGAVADLAYWSASMTISGVVLHASKISKAIYPKLLGGGKKEYFEENFTRVFYFVFPLAAMSLAFAKPALFTLNPLYEVANPVVIFLTFVIFLRTMDNVFTQALSGIEKVDIDEKATFKDYLHSKLFSLPTLTIIQRGVYLGSVIVLFLLLVPQTNSKIDLVVFWSIIAFLTQIPYTIYLYVLVRKNFMPKIDFKAISKYLATSIFVFGITFILMEQFLNYKISIFEFLPEFLQFVAIGVGGYLAITYAIDSKTRKFFKSVINEIVNKSES
ncbi:MAG: hypothetical protein WEC35_05290 [Nitrosopumilaceae archaeon]